jgi:hypothetical protein
MRRAISSALKGVSGREESFVWSLFKTGVPQLEEVLRATYGRAGLPPLSWTLERWEPMSTGSTRLRFPFAGGV